MEIFFAQLWSLFTLLGLLQQYNIITFDSFNFLRSALHILSKSCPSALCSRWDQPVWAGAFCWRSLPPRRGRKTAPFSGQHNTPTIIVYTASVCVPLREGREEGGRGIRLELAWLECLYSVSIVLLHEASPVGEGATCPPLPFTWVSPPPPPRLFPYPPLPCGLPQRFPRIWFMQVHELWFYGSAEYCKESVGKMTIFKGGIYKSDKGRKNT